MEKIKLIVPGSDHIQGFKEEQRKFSEQIDKKIKKGLKKNDSAEEGTVYKI